jgi:two-component system chemotaxis sensor kinase CheA
MTSFDHLKTTYFEECAELLEVTYTQLGAIEDGRADAESVHAIFRAIHSIKGGGGAFGFERLVAFAHAFETVLDLLRDGRLDLAPPVAALLLRSTDALSDLVAAARTGEDKPLGAEDDLLAALHAAAASDAPAPGLCRPDPASSGLATMADGAPARRYRIRFVPHAGLFRSANEPLLIIRDLKRLGRVDVEADLSRLPGLAVIDPEAAYLAWTLHVETGAPAAALAQAFEFVADDCELLIEPEPDLSGIASASPEAEPVPLAAVRRPGVSSDPAAPAATTDGGAAGHPSIRVDVDRVDRLVNLVGELVINQAMLVQLGSALPPDLCAGLLNGLETMSQHLRELQDGVMAIRAQPVRSVFSRMPRLVREVSAQLGKDVRLIVSGEGTEIDKTVIEQLADPLIHLLRNALDHGIEPPEEREALGKPRQGTIHLGAAHRGGRIVIEVADDGAGIARAKVLARARSRGLVAADATPTEEEIDNLIFLPGFSTVEVVSDISGRGVGMDVVKRNIQALGGRIAVESRAGAGSRFLLSLPLTLAILDGMAVAVGRESYIIPLANIMESLRPKRQNIHPVVGRGDVIAIRGDYVPLVYLHQRFLVPGAVTDPCEGIVVIVESEGAGRIGLVVDELLGQQQVVVKSLDANYGAVDGVGGATILGDGRVALILDVNRLQEAPALFRSPEPRPAPAFPATPQLQ